MTDWRLLPVVAQTAALVIALAFSLPAHASLETDVLNRWFAMLERGDAAGLSGLIASNAKIQLDDLGATQTKAEFLASMDEWSEAIKGGSIRYKVEGTAGGSATALVCYHFLSNDKLMREKFRFVSGRITYVQQSDVAKSCDGF